MIPAELLEQIEALEGLGAVAGRAAYLELLGGDVEYHARTADLATLSGCALVIRGLWRRWIRHPLLDRPYVIGRAVADLVAIAREAGALTSGLDRCPEPGDVVIVGGGPDGGGAEHAYQVVTVDDAGGGVLAVTSIDGGQVTIEGHQVIRRRQRTISPDGWDQAGGTDPGGCARRRVRWVIDTARVLERANPDAART